MRVGIIGAGAIGGCIASVLAEAGHDVEVTARGANLKAIQQRGLRRTGAFGDAHVDVAAHERLQHRPELAILATKVNDAAGALTENRDVLGTTPLLVVQNGVGGEQEAARLLGHERVAAGIALSAINALEPGIVTVTAAGDTVIGGHEQQRFFDLLDAAMPRVSRTENIEGAQWTKLVINMVNALPAITDFSVQEAIATPALRRVITASMREASRVGLATHVEFQQLAGVSPWTIRLLARAPLWLAERVPLRIAAAMGSTPNLGSTLQSIRRGQPTEIDALNGAVVTAGRRSGVHTPVNDGIVRLVHEREASGQLPALEEVFALA